MTKMFGRLFPAALRFRENYTTPPLICNWIFSQKATNRGGEFVTVHMRSQQPAKIHENRLGGRDFCPPAQVIIRSAQPVRRPAWTVRGIPLFPFPAFSLPGPHRFSSRCPGLTASAFRRLGFSSSQLRQSFVYLLHHLGVFCLFGFFFGDFGFGGPAGEFFVV